jgi:hypothetical protein
MTSAERTGVHVWRLAYAVDQIKGVVCHDAKPSPNYRG